MSQDGKLRAQPRALHWKKAVRGAAIGALAVAGATSIAHAKTVNADPVTDAKAAEANAKIQELEQQLEALSAQVADLKASTASDLADVRNTAAANQVTLANGRPTIANLDGTQKFAVRALFQFDATRYIEDDKSQLDLNSGGNFRRARLGVEGQYKDWSYALTGEFGGSGAEAAQLNQAWVEYAGLRPGFLANPVRLRVGAWAQPANLEDATNNTDSLFLERPGVSELNRSVAAGDGRSGVGFNANGDKWYAGSALTGDLVGQGSATPTTPISDEQTGYTARLAYALLKGPNHALHVGANFNGVIDPQDSGAGTLTTKTIRLRERPELRVDDTRLVDTGAIASEGLTSYGGELGANWKNLYGSAEYFKFDLDRSGALSDPKFNGWYVQGAWTLTGEQHQWNAAAGGFKGIKPANEFNPARANGARGTGGALQRA